MPAAPSAPPAVADRNATARCVHRRLASTAMGLLLRVLLLLALVVGPGAIPWGPVSPLVPTASAAANPFRVDVQGVALKPGTSGTARVRVIVPSGHHVYRDMMYLRSPDAGGLVLGQADFPPGLKKSDPANPGSQRELYDMDVLIDVPVKAPDAPGTYTATLEIGYQGCRGGLCFMPAVEQLPLVVKVSADAPAADERDEGGDDGSPDQAKPDQGAQHDDDTKDDDTKDEEDSEQGARVWPPFGGEAAWVSAGGGAGAPLVPASEIPSVDFSGLPDSAAVRPPGQQDRRHPVLARLLVDKQQLRVGDSFRLGVHLEQDQGWHTYWKSPGDIGLPTDITWGLPAGASFSDYQYPVPERYDVQGIISYGYSDQVLLFTQVQLPDGLTPGEHRLTAEVSWLVCEVMCIPGSAQLELPVELLPADAPAPQDSAFTPLFDHFADRQPTPPVKVQDFGVEAALSASAVRPEEGFQAVFLLSPTAGELSWETRDGAGSWPAFTPIVGNNWMVSEVRTQDVEGGLLVVVDAETFAADPLPDDDRIGGLFQVQADGRAIATELILDLPWAASGAPVQASNSPLFALARGEDPVAAATRAPAPADGALPEPEEGRSFALMLLAAFVGGAILNIMPCVLPVLTLKLYSLVAQQEAGAAHRKKAGLAYSGGIVASFVALALLVVGLKASFGASVGWGFQFQYPGYVAALATVVFTFGLSLFGVFEVPAMGANKAAEASNQEGMLGYFLTGVFTTLLATPCSAPFLGTGMGFAFSLPAWGILLFFAVAGLGLASPFLVIAFVPGMMRFMPRPGPWMETFKHLMGFTLLATTVWLVDVLGAQVGREGVTGFLIFLLVVGVGAWIFGRFGGPTRSVGRQLGAFGVGVALAAGVGWRFVELDFVEAATTDAVGLQTADLDFSEEIPWQAFSDQRVEELAGRTVFVDFTADWCLTCKVNERTVLSAQSVRQGLDEHDVVPLKADWTRKDEEITRWLERFGRAGVPFYLVIPADRSRDPIPLGEVITPQSVLQALDEAGS